MTGCRRREQIGEDPDRGLPAPVAHERVQPVGWWGRVARQGGPAAPLQALGRRLKLTMLMTASLFLALIGLARLLVPLPWVAPYLGWLALAGAVVLAPLWWPALKAETFTRAGSGFEAHAAAEPVDEAKRL